MDISVIVPLYKGQKYINKILRMIEANKQNLYDGCQLEVIFVNDCPAERISLPDLAGRSIDAVKIFVNESNIGIHGSRIHGLRKASGKWILFLDQDDTIADTYFASQLGKAGEHDAVASNGYWRNGEKIYSETYPLSYPFSFDTFLDGGYPLISLGQLLVRRQAVPDEWTKEPLEHNGCDDLYLWAIMMAHGARVAVNDDTIYTHEEDGKNASLNYKEMRLSIENVKRNFLSTHCADAERGSRFSEMMDKIASKYSQYEKMDRILGHTDAHQIESYLSSKNIKDVAIYGIGIYGKALLKILEDTRINVLYGIDARADVKSVSIPVFSIDSGIQPVDAVIVTPIFDFDNICQMLMEKKTFACQIIGLDKIL